MTDTFRLAAGPAALLVDGDNIAAAHAMALLAACAHPPIIRRVYADLTQRKDWCAQPAFRAFHSGTGKNATDILMTVDAMELALSGTVTAVWLASSDADFAHLAHRLRERGLSVIGMGEGKTPGAFRAACTRFVTLVPQAAPQLPKPAPAALSALERKIADLIQQAGGKLAVQSLGPQSGLKLADLGTKSWRPWLAARPHLFDLDAKGPSACVRLKG